MSKWEINRVSTPERILEKIKTEMPRPVGIVIFGADCDFKKEVIDEVIDGLEGFVSYHDKAPDTATLVRALGGNCAAMVVALDSSESAMHGLRHELVKVMRNAGAKSMVGIYAKAKKKSIPFGKAMISAARDKQINQQIDAIEQSNPTADGLDYFIVATEEEG